MRFQSTLPQGERHWTHGQKPQPFHFNPRSRKGSDFINPAIYDQYSHFNPRSRKGSDHSTFFVKPDKRIFQSTLPQGERQAVKNVGSDVWIFQSTLPQGERQPDRRGPLDLQDFNPRSRKGSDDLVAQVSTIVMTISIHAPARGATI